MKRILLGFCVGVLFSCLNGIAAAASLFKRGFSMLSKFRSGRAVLVCSLSAAAAVCLFFAVGFDTAKGQAVSTAGGLTAGTASVDFGDLTSGGSPEQTVTLSNTSAKDVTIQRIAAGSADFAVDPSATSCPRPGGILGAGSNCSIALVFEPMAAGARTAVLKIVSNAADSPQVVFLGGEQRPGGFFGRDGGHGDAPGVR